MPEIILRVEGKEFAGWTSAIVEKSLYQMTGTFGLTTTNKFPGNFKKWGFAMGSECQVAIDDQILITGYIEDILISYDAKNHNIQIAGRDKTGDLIDCSYIAEPKLWEGQKIIEVIRALCDPFSIEVIVSDPVIDQADSITITEQTDSKTTCNSFKINEGETVFDSILRLCQMQAILPVSYGDGKLTLTRAGTEKTNDSLELGKNIKSGRIEQSNRDRFQTYIVKGQGKKQKGSLKSSESTDQVKGEYTDDLIDKTNRYRPIVILAEEKGEAKDFRIRAKWECINRAGKSRNIIYEIQGWTQSNGKVWPLNTLVQVKDHYLEINKKLLISKTKFSIDNEAGTMTELTIVPPETFQLPVFNPTDKMKAAADWDPLTDFKYHNL